MLRNTTKLAAMATSALLLTAGCSSGDVGAGAATGTTVQVRVLDMKFDPAVVTISPGDTVEWAWEASLPHDVASMEGAPVAFASELQTSGTYAQTFETAGVYDYTCTPHPQMTGQVIVEG